MRECISNKEFTTKENFNINKGERLRIHNDVLNSRFDVIGYTVFSCDKRVEFYMSKEEYIDISL